MTADVDVNAVLDRVGQNLQVSRAFGQPFERDGALVIPVAFVAGGGGTNKQPADPKGQEGAGFGGVVYPLGVYVVRQGEVRFRPSVDTNLLAVLGFLFLTTVLGRRRWRRRLSAHA